MWVSWQHNNYNLITTVCIETKTSRVWLFCVIIGFFLSTIKVFKKKKKLNRSRVIQKLYGWVEMLLWVASLASKQNLFVKIPSSYPRTLLLNVIVPTDTLWWVVLPPGWPQKRHLAWFILALVFSPRLASGEVFSSHVSLQITQSSDTR